MKFPNIRKATDHYESWLAGHTILISQDLRHKHQLMAGQSVAFLRATYYRWAQIWSHVCPRAADAPRVLAIGDIHLENFGLWRDAEGRTIWGINDFDECDSLPYTNDLVRLAASTLLAIHQGDIELRPKAACEAILEGYREWINNGGGPILTDSRKRWLRTLLPKNLHRPSKFWKEITQGDPMYAGEEAALQRAVAAMPEGTQIEGHCHRIAGVGSLGRARILVWGYWRGGPVAREAKSLAPPATAWVNSSRPANTQYGAILQSAIRAVDPFTMVKDEIVSRRLAAESGKVDLKPIAAAGMHGKLLKYMGREIANIHLGDVKLSREIEQDIDHRKPDWLFKASKRLAVVVLKDWLAWRHYWKRHKDHNGTNQSPNRDSATQKISTAEAMAHV